MQHRKLNSREFSLKLERADNMQGYKMKFKLVIFLLFLSTSISSMQRVIPLHNAAKIGDTKKLESLINAGANVNYSDDFGITSLMLAALHGKVEAVKLLLSYGADASATDGNGKSALYYAKFTGIPSEQKAELIRFLEEAGADQKSKIE